MPNATSLANYFIDIAKRDEVDLTLFGLMKRVYITHGFCLAIYNRPAINSRFDSVEAWKYGPVIPSVYHSFKHNRSNPIKEKSLFVIEKNDAGSFDFVTPELEDLQIRSVAEFVWRRYHGYDDKQIIDLTHQKGTPWHFCYEEGKNKDIPDYITKVYYDNLVKK